MDLAEFTGPIEVASLSSRGGGRGIVAKRDIKFGELLVVSKAFAFCALDPANPEVYAAINLITNIVDSGFRAVVAIRVAELIAGNPRAVDAINQLYAGPANEPPSQFSTVPSGKQRDQTSNKISSYTATSVIRSQIKKLEETYEGYADADRYATYKAYRALLKLYKTNSDHVNALQVIIKSLKYVGLEVTDTSIRGHLAPSVHSALPIKLLATAGSETGSRLGHTAVDDCIAIHNIFGGEFDDMSRAAKWLKGAVWLHYGGGQDLFWERYPHLSHHRDLL
ncbi:hypothetical protein FRC04_009814 [Tulasnella sp. 424]|nr:hypothetical protein FRC04_009814 [Tulasnella sp. 424]